MRGIALNCVGGGDDRSGRFGRGSDRALVRRPARWLIQQGLRNEGFEPEAADGRFGPRNRAATRLAGGSDDTRRGQHGCCARFFCPMLSPPWTYQNWQGWNEKVCRLAFVYYKTTRPEAPATPGDSILTVGGHLLILLGVSCFCLAEAEGSGRTEMADSASTARRLRMGMAAAVPTLVLVMSVPIAVAATNGAAVQQEAAATATARAPAAVEASLGLDRPERRLIQQGLRNEGFDPGAPDGLFGPRTRAAGNAQLPPEITVDRLLVRVDRLLAENDPGAAFEAMNEILGLHDEHDLQLPNDLHFRYARVAFAAGQTETAVASLNEYLVGVRLFCVESYLTHL